MSPAPRKDFAAMTIDFLTTRRSSLFLSAVAAFAVVLLTSGVAGGGHLDRALEAQRALVDRDPDNTAALVDFANLLQLSGRTDEAEATYRRALSIDEKQVAARYNLALLLQGRGSRSQAYREYKRVLKLAPNHAWAHYQVGTLHEASGNQGAAIRAYAEAFALDPRLRFPDVNPHVIDNRFVTQATLQAYQLRETLIKAPKTYEDPRRIASLLYGVEPAPAATAAPVAPETKGPQEPAVESVTKGAAAPSAAKVVGPGDVIPGHSSGMATGGGAAAAAAPNRFYQPPQYQPAPLVDEEPVVVDEGEVKGSPLVPGATFVPGAQSNGRIETGWRRDADSRRG
jgi:hypothetical protein